MPHQNTSTSSHITGFNLVKTVHSARILRFETLELKESTFDRISNSLLGHGEIHSSFV